MSNNITIVGSGYVGMSLAALLAKNHHVTIYDIDLERVQKINDRISPIKDPLIENTLKNPSINIIATNNNTEAYFNADFIIVATSTDYLDSNKGFDTSSVDMVVSDALSINKKCLIIIKSTIPVGHTDKLKKINKSQKIIFSPEFLREGNALEDNLYPSRIVVGGKCDLSKQFGNIIKRESQDREVELIFTDSMEAEAIKLFSNTYLAMRISFFNELDSFTLANNLDTKSIINAVCLDQRIGQEYNNPSFGYGGYCLPKDSKQLLKNYDMIPQELIRAIVLSNQTRKNFIFKEILKLKPKSIGFYRLVMKKGSDNFRSSAIIDLIKKFQDLDIKLYFYEPLLNSDSIYGALKIKNLEEFKKKSSLIVANRKIDALMDVRDKCFSRDIYGSN